jgi:hypothetical protein
MDKEFFPDFIMQSNYLNCNHVYNPRCIWTSIKQLNVEDITDVYRDIGIITARDDMTQQLQLASTALVLLPKNLEKNFAKYSNINTVESLSSLNISCIHREDIKLLFGTKNYIYKNYPHLIQGESLDLISKKIKLETKHLLIIMSTCLDLGNSPVFNFYIIVLVFFNILHSLSI